MCEQLEILTRKVEEAVWMGMGTGAYIALAAT